MRKFNLETNFRQVFKLAGDHNFHFLPNVHHLFENVVSAYSGAALGTGMVLIPQIMGPQGQAQAPAAPLIVCPKCHAYVPATAKFCPECGTRLKPPKSATIICPKCAHFIPASSKFCPQCGTQLAHTATQLGT